MRERKWCFFFGVWFVCCFVLFYRFILFWIASHGFLLFYGFCRVLQLVLFSSFLCKTFSMWELWAGDLNRIKFPNWTFVSKCLRSWIGVARKDERIMTEWMNFKGYIRFIRAGGLQPGLQSKRVGKLVAQVSSDRTWVDQQAIFSADTCKPKELWGRSCQSLVVAMSVCMMVSGPMAFYAPHDPTQLSCKYLSPPGYYYDAKPWSTATFGTVTRTVEDQPFKTGMLLKHGGGRRPEDEKNTKQVALCKSMAM